MLYALKRMLVMLLAVGIFTAGGCSSIIGTSSTANAEKRTVIRWMFWFPEPTEFINAFNESQDEIKLEYEDVSGNNYPLTLNQEISAGEEPDLYCIYYRETYESQAKAGKIVDLTGRGFWDNFDPTAIDQNKAKDGRLYGMPTTATFNCMFYNKDILKKYGIAPPADWQSFLKACEKLKSAGVTPQVQGLMDLWQCKYIGLNPVSALLYKDSAWVEKLNAGKTAWTDSNCLALFQKKEDFIKKGYIEPDSIKMTFQKAWQSWCEEKSAFIAGGSYYINNAFVQQRPEFDWDVLPIPYNEPGEPTKIEYFTDNATIVVNSKSKNVDKALKFVEWFAKPENMRLWSKSTLNLSPEKKPNFDFDPAAEKFRVLYNYDTFKFEREPDYVSTEFGKVQQEMMVGTKSALQAVQDLQRAMQTALD